jgi:hypothetical protein
MTTNAHLFTQKPFQFERASSERRVSNSRPQPWQGCALPTELLSHLLLLFQRTRDLNPPRRITLYQPLVRRRRILSHLLLLFQRTHDLNPPRRITLYQPLVRRRRILSHLLLLFQRTRDLNPPRSAGWRTLYQPLVRRRRILSQ